MTFEKFYDKNYKKFLILPAVLILISIVYIFIYTTQTGSPINPDVTLTGGTVYTIQTTYSASEMEQKLAEKFEDFEVKSISDNAGNQLQLIITCPEDSSELIKADIESILGFKLTIENSSKEQTDSSLSSEFYSQLLIAIILAFFWMAAAVFIIFSKGKKRKFWVIITNILFALFLGNFFLKWNPILSLIVFLAFAVGFIYTYIKNSVPAFAVMLSAFADIVMTLALVDLIGMKISTAGIVAFLMLIGYSVDSDIMLTSRLLRKKESVNGAIKGAFKTGSTMTFTSIIAIGVALIVVYPFASVLNQIFIILLFGLSFDLLNTWIANASILKWYVESSSKEKTSKFNWRKKK